MRLQRYGLGLEVSKSQVESRVLCTFLNFRPLTLDLQTFDFLTFDFLTYKLSSL